MPSQVSTRIKRQIDTYLDGLPTDDTLREVQNNLEGVTLVKPAQHRLAHVFTLIFRESFMDTPFHLWVGANKSNWTYHTAFAIREAAKTLMLECIFETKGRFDALVQTMEEKPRTVLLTEWESNYKSVFGQGKELEKLWKGLQRKRNAHALLLTYCPQDDFNAFVKQVVAYWQERASRRAHFPILFLLVAVYQVTKEFEQLQFLRTIEVLPTEVLLWNDLHF